MLQNLSESIHDFSLGGIEIRTINFKLQKSFPMNLKNTYFGISLGMLFLFLLTVISFIVIGVNKEESIFDNVAVTMSLAISLMVFLGGFSISLYLAFKKPKTS